MLVVGLIVLQVIIFVALIIVFRRVMSKNVTLATSHLEELNEEYTKKEQEVEARLQEVQSQAQQILQQAQVQAETAKEQIVKSAQQEKDALIQQARSEAQDIMHQADKARQQLLNELEERISRQAVKKACVLLGDSLPPDFKQEVHARWVKDLLESGFHDTAHLKLPENEKQITVVSAFDLTPADTALISRKLGERFGKEVKITTETDAGLIAGLLIRIGSIVLDGSLQHKIRENAL